jgi:uncharacterized protein (DUF4415 family)
MKKLSESSRHGKRRESKEKLMKTSIRNLDQEIAALMKLRDQDIDTSDIPEVRDWSKAVVGKFYRPLKEPITIRLDVDIIAWLKAGGPGYQTRINALLRKTMTPEPTQSLTEDTGAKEQCMSSDATESASAGFSFPYLENHHQLAKYGHVAHVIVQRGSVFAPAA